MMLLHRPVCATYLISRKQSTMTLVNKVHVLGSECFWTLGTNSDHTFYAQSQIIGGQVPKFLAESLCLRQGMATSGRWYYVTDIRLRTDNTCM